ncbi:MAG TPA: hypothetical protein VFP98_03495, partial [Candidatus Polarisedimenticolia bacterium]|nr:hypothetical protein [Candidatus Polarisedimenticolia bacterium]
VDKDPSVLTVDPLDEEGFPERRAQRHAERIFEGAGERTLSIFVERLVGEAAALQAARAYLDGIRLDIGKDGAVGVNTGKRSREAEAAASVSLIVLGKPRVEVRSTLPGDIRARLELPLLDGVTSGARVSLSRQMNPGLRGTLGAGFEDSGRGSWVSAGVEVRF